MGQVVTSILQGVNLSDPSTLTSCDLLYVVQNVIQLMFQLSIVLAVAYSIFGAFLIMTARGNEDTVGKGRGAITAAVTGLAISLTAWLLIDSLINILGGNASIGAWNQLSCH